MNWISVVQNRLHWPAIMKEENFLSVLPLIRISKRTLLRTDTQLFTCGKNSNRRVQKYKIHVSSNKK